MRPERRVVSISCWEKPQGRFYTNTCIIITPLPPETVPLKFLCTLVISPRKATVWRLELAQLIEPVPEMLPAIAGRRLTWQIQQSLHIAIQKDMLDAGLLENMRLAPFSMYVIDLSRGVNE